MYEIEKNIAIPSSSKGRVKYPELWALAKTMEIGDSILVRDEYEAKHLVKYISYGRTNDAPPGQKHHKGSYRVLEEGARVWRVQ